MQGARVLIVDDDSSVARILARIFERSGFVATTAPDGEWALALLAEQHFDALICDIQMPRLDGRQLCERLAARGPHLPACTLIVTSRPEQEQRAWIDDFPGLVLVEKPVGPKHLLRLVRQRLLDVAQSDTQRRAA
ncbi:MAG: response regulator [Candidatus Eisenbacteria bacterium]